MNRSHSRSADPVITGRHTEQNRALQRQRDEDTRRNSAQRLTQQRRRDVKQLEWGKPWRSSLSAAIALFLAGCSPEPASEPGAAQSTQNEGAPPAPAPSAAASRRVPADASVAPSVLTLEGLGILRIGEPLPAGSTWKEGGAQLPGPCRTVCSPDFTGIYAIIEEGKVRRVTVAGRSMVKLIEGIGIGTSEAAVRSAFPGFREEPHKYVESPAKYLTAPNAGCGDPALRFEIGRDGKVSLIHVGTMPVLGYVEGCA